MVRFTPAVLFGLLLFLALPGVGSGQIGLPWLSSGQPQPPQSSPVEESQLPLARARLEGDGPVWVGQAVPLTIEVIVPTWFAGAPRFPEIDIPKAVVLSPEGAVNFVAQSGSKTFSGQSRRYLLFPEEKGMLVIPSVRVEVSYTLADGKPSAPKLLTSSPLRIEARFPPGAEKAKHFVTTTGLKVDQSLDGKVNNLRVGDAVTRTITITAENTVGMSLPPLKFEAPEGVKLYPGASKVTETAERGKIEARRTDTVTYVAEKAGHYELPEITILWWDPRGKTMNRATLHSISLIVKSGSSSSTEQFASSQTDEQAPGNGGSRPWSHRQVAVKWSSVLLAATLFFLIVRRLLVARHCTLRFSIAEWHRRRTESEACCFRQFRAASLSGEPEAAFGRLMRWLDRMHGGVSAPTLRQFVSETGISGLSEEVSAITDRLFSLRPGTGPKWSGKQLYRLVSGARRVQMKKAARKQATTVLIRNLND